MTDGAKQGCCPDTGKLTNERCPRLSMRGNNVRLFFVVIRKIAIIVDIELFAVDKLFKYLERSYDLFS